MKALNRAIILAGVSVAFFISSYQLFALTAAGAQQSGANSSAAKSAAPTTTNVFIILKTTNIIASSVGQELQHQKGWSQLDAAVVQDPDDADLTVEIDRPEYAYVYSFVIADKLSSKVLASGTVTAMNAAIAPGAMAREIVKSLATVIKPSTGNDKKSHGKH